MPDVMKAIAVGSPLVQWGAALANILTFAIAVLALFSWRRQMKAERTSRAAQDLLIMFPRFKRIAIRHKSNCIKIHRHIIEDSRWRTYELDESRRNLWDKVYGDRDARYQKEDSNIKALLDEFEGKWHTLRIMREKDVDENFFKAVIDAYNRFEHITYVDCGYEFDHNAEDFYKELDSSVKAFEKCLDQSMPQYENALVGLEEYLEALAGMKKPFLSRIKSRLSSS